MTVTPDQARMLTTLAIASRPNGAARWDSAGIMAAIKAVSDRSLAEVIMAVTRAAADRDVDNPGVIPSAGSHWAETTTVRTRKLDVAPAGTRCTACGQAEHRGDEDHPFTRPSPPDAEAYGARVAELRATLEPTAGPTSTRTFDDLAEANPELHARVDALRQANPGLDSPPLHEPAPPAPPQPSGAAASETEPQEVPA